MADRRLWKQHIISLTLDPIPVLESDVKLIKVSQLPNETETAVKIADNHRVASLTSRKSSADQ